MNENEQAREASGKRYSVAAAVGMLVLAGYLLCPGVLVYMIYRNFPGEACYRAVNMAARPCLALAEHCSWYRNFAEWESELLGVPPIHARVIVELPGLRRKHP